MRNSLNQDELSRASGAGIKALILDSGVETSHPSLAGRNVRNWRVEGGELETRRIVPHDGDDTFGHGTACASILLEHAPAITLEAIQVFCEPRGRSEHVLAALHWGIDRGFHVINCSFTTPEARYLPEYKSVVDRAFCRNVWIVSACNNAAHWRVEYPGSFPTVLSTDYGKLPPLQLRHRPGELVEFIARGQDVRVAWKGGTWRIMSGSSLAAPHLAALACRLRQLRPDWNACQAKAALYDLAAGNPQQPE